MEPDNTTTITLTEDEKLEVEAALAAREQDHRHDIENGHDDGSITAALSHNIAVQEKVGH